MQANNTVVYLDGSMGENTYGVYGEQVDAADQLFSVADLANIGAATGKKAVLLTVNDSPETLTLPLDDLDMIAIDFPSFTDGRGYSFAVLLRRQGFKGELRAVGDVFKDVMFYLSRCGFDAFVPKADKDPEVMLMGLKDFPSGYQQAIATEQQPNYQAK